MNGNEESPHTPNRNSHSSSNKAPPLHLSEFYSFVNGNNNNNSSSSNNNRILESPISITTTTTESNSQLINNSSLNSTRSSQIEYNLNEEEDSDYIIITLKDILKIINKYEQVIKKGQLYSELLQKLSQLSSEFGESIEELAKLKGSDQFGEDFINISGLQFVNSNYELILSNLIIKNLIEPLKVKLELFKKYQFQYDYQYQLELKLKLKNLQNKEIELKKFNKFKKKNLNFNLISYKNNLISITNELSTIENFKKLNYNHLLIKIEEFEKKILNDLSCIVRLQLEINEIILKKSWSGGGLDELMTRCPDPFNEMDLDKDLDNGMPESIQESRLTQPQPNTNQVESDIQSEDDTIQDELNNTIESELMRDNSFTLPMINN